MYASYGDDSNMEVLVCERIHCPSGRIRTRSRILGFWSVKQAGRQAVGQSYGTQLCRTRRYSSLRTAWMPLDGFRLEWRLQL